MGAARRDRLGWQDVLPYFRRAEGNARGADAWHGADALTVSDLRFRNPFPNDSSRRRTRPAIR